MPVTPRSPEPSEDTLSSAPSTVHDSANWPAPLQPVVQARGVDAVWKTGLAILGYPPTWANCYGEYAAIQAALGHPVQ
jgi:hypothetical protein